MRGTALVLALDIGRVHRLAGILKNRVAQDFCSSRLGVDFDIDDMSSKAHSCSIGIELMVARNGAAGRCRLGSDLLERQRREIAGIGAGGLGMAIFPSDRISRDSPYLGSAPAKLLYRIAGSEDGRHA